MVNKMEKCCVPGCNSNSRKKVIFNYPLALENMGNIKICEDHFEPSEIITIDDQKELQNGAIPTIFEIDHKCCRFCMKLLKSEREKTLIDDVLKSNYEELIGRQFSHTDHLPGISCVKCSKEIQNSAIIKRKITETQSLLEYFLQLKESTIDQSLLRFETKPDQVDFNSSIFNNDSFDDFNMQFSPEVEVKTEEFEIISQTNEIDNADIEIKKEPLILLEKVDHSIPKKTKARSKKSKAKPAKKTLMTERKRKKLNKLQKLTDDFTSERYKCTCGYSVERCNFTAHIHRKHLGNTKFICDFCGAASKRKKDLHDHIVVRHIPDEFCPRFFCTQENCNKSYKTRKMLSGHIAQDHLQTAHKICELCGASLKNHSLYMDHMRIKHTLEKPFVCKEEGCTARYATATGLFDHKQRHHVFVPTKCEICNRVFRSKKLRNSHRFSAHKEANFECDFQNCGKKYKSLPELKAHRDSTHFGIKKYQCDVCNAQFQRQNHVKRHITSVHMKPEYKCEADGCKAKYARKDFLWSHTKSHHCNLDPEKFNDLLESVRKMKELKLDKTNTFSKIQ